MKTQIKSTKDLPEATRFGTLLDPISCGKGGLWDPVWAQNLLKSMLKSISKNIGNAYQNCLEMIFKKIEYRGEIFEKNNQ